MDDWLPLTYDEESVEPSLVFLKTFCVLPSIELLGFIKQRFVLFGPIYRWHHVNFGTFSEMPLGSMSHLFEAHMSKKLAACNKTRTDLQILLDADQTLEWYSQQQISVYHSKIRPFPIGFGYMDYRTVGEIDTRVEIFKQLMLSVLEKSKGVERDTLVVASFNTHKPLYVGVETQNPRTQLLNILQTTSSLQNRSIVKFYETDEEWLTALSRAKYIVSPVGWGPDCHRTYEAIAMGCVPIVVEEYTVSRLLESMPALIVRSWDELAQGGAEFLEKQYEILCKRHYTLDKLFYDYWEKRLLLK